MPFKVVSPGTSMWSQQDLVNGCARFGVKAWWNISNGLTPVCGQWEEGAVNRREQVCSNME